MKTKRNLSGIYFRVKTEEGTFDNVCFEDLTLDQQNDILDENSKDWVDSLAKQLAETINKIGDALNITSS